MPTPHFRPGDDPRRHALTAAERAVGLFGEGNTAGIQHGLSRRLADPLKRLPKEFHVVLAPDAPLDELETRLGELIALATLVHDTLRDAPSMAPLAAMGKYSQIGRRANRLLLRLQGRSGLPAEQAGEASAEQIAAGKARTAHLLSGDLTKLKHAYHFIGLMGDVMDEQWRPFPWVETGLATVLVSAINHLEDLAKIALHETRETEQEDDEYIQAVARARVR